MFCLPQLLTQYVGIKVSRRSPLRRYFAVDNHSAITCWAPECKNLCISWCISFLISSVLDPFLIRSSLFCHVLRNWPPLPSKANYHLPLPRADAVSPSSLKSVTLYCGLLIGDSWAAIWLYTCLLRRHMKMNKSGEWLIFLVLRNSFSFVLLFNIYCCPSTRRRWRTGVRVLRKGLTTPKGNQVGWRQGWRTPRWAWASLSVECDTFSFSALMLSVGRQEEGIRPIESRVSVCWWWRWD